MIPIPTHLKAIALPSASAPDENRLEAHIRCTCGADIFELLYPGETQDSEGRQVPCTLEIDGCFYFLVRVRCVACLAEHLIVDQDFHGWNGFVCHDEDQASLPRPPLTLWPCRKCGSTSHSVGIRIRAEGKEDFIEEAGPDFDPERWPDAFSWIDIDIECKQCASKARGWVSLETM